jgi:hypothetical protein
LRFFSVGSYWSVLLHVGLKILASFLIRLVLLSIVLSFVKVALRGGCGDGRFFLLAGDFVRFLPVGVLAALFISASSVSGMII